jgi:hypothetical protein
MVSMANDDEDLDRQAGDRFENPNLLPPRLVVEVHPRPAHPEALDAWPHVAEMARLDQDAAEEIGSAADRLIDEGVGGAESAGHFGEPFRASPRLAATAWSAAATAWA